MDLVNPVSTATPEAVRLLEVENLAVRFGDKAVVRGVSLAIAAGEKLALVGESGSEKPLPL